MTDILLVPIAVAMLAAAAPTVSPTPDESGPAVVRIAPGGPGDVAARVPMRLVRGLDRIVPHPQPLRRPLASEAPEGLDLSAVPAPPDGEADGRLHGAVPVTNVEEVPFVVSPARDAIWLDSNRDGRLLASERVEVGSTAGRNRWFFSEAVIRQVEDGLRHQESVPIAVAVSGTEPPRAFSRLDAWREAWLEHDGGRTRIAVVDETFRGWFSHRGRDRLLVDRDGDGLFASSPGSHEHYRLGEPFPVGDLDLVVDEIAPLGTELLLRHSEKPARRPPSLEIGAEAPDFTVRTLAGEGFSLGDHAGRWVLLDFWATWCRPCVRELPHLKELRRTQPDLVVLGLSGDRTRLALERFVEAQEIDWPQVYEGADAVQRLYRVSSFPRSFLIAPDGTVAARDLRGSALVTRVAALREARPTERPAERPATR